MGVGGWLPGWGHQAGSSNRLLEERMGTHCTALYLFKVFACRENRQHERLISSPPPPERVRVTQTMFDSPLKTCFFFFGEKARDELKISLFLSFYFLLFGIIGLFSCKYIETLRLCA